MKQLSSTILVENSRNKSRGTASNFEWNAKAGYRGCHNYVMFMYRDPAASRALREEVGLKEKTYLKKVIRSALTPASREAQNVSLEAYHNKNLCGRQNVLTTLLNSYK